MRLALKASTPSPALPVPLFPGHNPLLAPAPDLRSPLPVRFFRAPAHSDLKLTLLETLHKHLNLIEIIGVRFGQLTITGTADIPLLIETSTDPLSTTWSPLQTCTLTNGLFEFTDSGSVNYPVRFYRIRPP